MRANINAKEMGPMETNVTPENGHPRTMGNRSYYAGMILSNFTGRYRDPEWSAFLMAAAEVADAVDDWTVDVQGERGEAGFEEGCQNLFKSVHRAAIALNEVWDGLRMCTPNYDFYTGKNGRRLVVVEGSPMTNGETDLVGEYCVGESKQTFTGMDVRCRRHNTPRRPAGE